LAINVDVHDKPLAPTAIFTFVDETQETFDTKDYVAADIMFQIHLKGMQLEAEYEMDGKNVDEL
jgi:hypothetical protein